MANQSKIPGRRGRDIHPYLRVAIIILCLFHTTDFHEISKAVGIAYDSAYLVWRRTTKRANTEVDLFDLLSHIDSLGTANAGRPPRVEDGSPESERVRKLLLSNPYSTFQEVIEDENLMHDQS